MVREIDMPKMPLVGKKSRDNKLPIEAEVRIAGLLAAYRDFIKKDIKSSKTFLKFWEFGDLNNDLSEVKKGAAALYSGTAIVVPTEEDFFDEELMLFLNMHPEVGKIRSTKAFGEKMMLLFGESLCFKSNAVMTPGENLLNPREIPERFTPRESYPLLNEVFKAAMPAFDDWYVDISHRIRHGCCRISGFKDGEKAVATAMTVAEDDDSALIGAVATCESERGRGYASSNVLSLSKELMSEGKQVLLSPKNDLARLLYEKIGFEICGYWGELERV